MAVARLLQEPTRALWGFGPESFYDVHLKGTLAGKPFDFLSCDNAWVEMLVETGFVGLGIMLCLLLTPAWLVWRGFRKKAGVDRQLSLVLFVNLVMFYLQMYSVGMYSWGQNGYALWILIAIALVHLRMTKPTVARSVVARTGQVTDSFVFQNACCSASLV